ncbi:hypothetical protein [Abyssisolibacter fermentans]|uniref:hypothetical protein n=1 Tax=Abyssisolibacter fermentans TaxID=1766203 RepID=UPI000836EDC0|nr:hypothetical protein [Abyssisolibacter fermentans]
MKKTKKISRILFWTGITAVIIAVLFILYALNHPESSFSWGINITYFIYVVYIVLTISLFVLSNVFNKKDKQHLNN